MNTKSKNVILDLSFTFAVEIIKYCELLEAKKKFIVANQLFRSATSVGALINESQSAESRSDFIHKLKIASKEAEETVYWLKLCNQAMDYPNTDSLLNKINQINKLLSKIISTAKKNQQK